MNSTWEKTYPNGYIKRYLDCAEYRVDNTHTVMIMRHNNCYDSYVMLDDHNGCSTPFLFMFGTPIGQMTYAEIVDMTITVAPDYYDMFEEDA